MSFTFTAEYQQRIDTIIKMQDIITNVSYENLQKSTQQLIKIYSDKFSDLIRNILSWSVFHPLNINLYSDLICSLCNSEQFDRSNCEKIVLSTCSHYIFKSRLHPVEASILHLLFQCYKRNVVKKEDIVEEIRNIYFNKRQYKSQISAFFIFFAPEVQEIDIELFNTIWKYVEINKFDYEIDTIVDFYDYFKQNNWEKLRLFRENVYCDDSILKILIEDDIDALKVCFAHPEFDINQKLKPPPLSPFYFLSDSSTLVSAAAALNASKCLNYLIMMNVSLDNGSHNLSFAAYGAISGNVEIIRFAEQNSCNMDGTLQMAVTFHHNDLFYYLHETRFPDLTTFSSTNKSVLSQVGSSNNVSILYYCIQQGLDLNVIDINNETILDRASYFGCNEVVEVLLMIPYININVVSLTPPICAAGNSGNSDILHEFQQSGKKVNINIPNNKGYTSLYLSIRSSHYQSFKLLLDQTTDFNERYRENLLSAAVHQNDVRILSDLLTKMKNLSFFYSDKEIIENIQIACVYGNDDVAKKLLEENPNIDFSKNRFAFSIFNLLEAAIYYFRFDFAKYLKNNTQLYITNPTHLIEKINQRRKKSTNPQIIQEALALVESFALIESFANEA